MNTYFTYGLILLIVHVFCMILLIDVEMDEFDTSIRELMNNRYGRIGILIGGLVVVILWPVCLAFDVYVVIKD